MNGHEDLLRRVCDEQDDVLATLQLVHGNDVLETRLFDQLVDLLVEGMFLDLRQRFQAGGLDREAYLTELASLGELCRSAGLLPLPGRNR
ncbi:MAG: hypothetical protein ACT4OV_12935 [Microthrixaceae bacterium]